jgi:hypothetical protein
VNATAKLAEFLGGLDPWTVYDMAIFEELKGAEVKGDVLMYDDYALNLPIEAGADVANQIVEDVRGGTVEDTLPATAKVVVGYRLAASLVSQIVQAALRRRASIEPSAAEAYRSATQTMGRGSAHRRYVEALRLYAESQS